MHELLATLGFLATAVCAALAYFKLGAIRKKQMRRKIGSPRDLGV